MGWLGSTPSHGAQSLESSPEFSCGSRWYSSRRHPGRDQRRARGYPGAGHQAACGAPDFGRRSATSWCATARSSRPRWSPLPRKSPLRSRITSASSGCFICSSACSFSFGGGTRRARCISSFSAWFPLFCFRSTTAGSWTLSTTRFIGRRSRRLMLAPALLFHFALVFPERAEAAARSVLEAGAGVRAAVAAAAVPRQHSRSMRWVSCPGSARAFCSTRSSTAISASTSSRRRSFSTRASAKRRRAFFASS